MKNLFIIGIISLFFVGLGSCANKWKVKGPSDCQKMCANWGLEFTAMVGIGDQDITGSEGATACVCQKRRGSQTTTSAYSGTANISAAIVALQQTQNNQNQNNNKKQNSY
jgi:hypothetical protein